jgi:hypothetical protein
MVCIVRVVFTVEGWLYRHPVCAGEELLLLLIVDERMEQCLV